MEPITVRQMRFEYPEDLDPVFIAGEPEESYVNVAVSLLLPYLEPYLIRSMRAARARITDPALLDALERFVAQEGQHYRQHAAFNAHIHAQSTPALAALEAEVAADYKRFTATRSLRFNLAYAEGFEAFTTAMALTFLDTEPSRWHPAALELFLWHLVEELEHRTVAFDVYDAVFGGYLYRLAVGLYAQFHLVRFVTRATEALLAGDPRVETEFGGTAGRKARVARLNRLTLRSLLPRVLRTLAPRYTPHDIAMPEAMREAAARFTREAVSTR